MQISTITSTNIKGQIVLPKAMRKALGINSQMPLNIVLAGKGIHIYPVEEVVTQAESESSYHQLLQKTKGSWGKGGAATSSQRSNLELKASKLRKQAW